jgi:hypothetical protein
MYLNTLSRAAAKFSKCSCFVHSCLSDQKNRSITQWLDKSFADLIAAIGKRKSIDFARKLPVARTAVNYGGTGNGHGSRSQTRSTWSMHRGSCED